MGQRRFRMDTPEASLKAPDMRSCGGSRCGQPQGNGTTKGAPEHGRCVNSGAPETATGTDRDRPDARHRQPGFGGTACGSRSTRPTGVR